MAQTSLGRYASVDAEWRRMLFWVAGFILSLLATTPYLVGSEPSSIWRNDFKAAQQEAEDKKLPLLIHFYADWCMPCQRMEREVFSSASVKEMLGSRFIAVKVNSDHHKALVDQFGVSTLPADVFVDSLMGKTIAVYSGYQDRTKYVINATQAETRFIAVHSNDLVIEKSAQNTVQTQSASGNMIDQIELGEPQPIIGLDGFSPVALTKNRQWNRGSPKFSWDYKDVTYYLASREELIEFRNSPDLFAPKLLGCDPVILWETEKAVAGDIRFGAFFDDELFLFKSEDRRRQFKASPEKYIRTQHALKADQIERTVMR